MSATPVEYISSLWRAFHRDGADFIVITSRRQQFLIESAECGLTRGLLTKEVDDHDEQSTVWRYRPTLLLRAILPMLPADKMRDPYFKELTPDMVPALSRLLPAKDES